MIPQESCHGCMQGKHSKVGYHTYANKIRNLPIGVFQYGDTFVKSLHLHLVDCNILLCMKMIRFITGLFYTQTTRMLPSFSFKR